MLLEHIGLKILLQILRASGAAALGSWPCSKPDTILIGDILAMNEQDNTNQPITRATGLVSGTSKPTLLVCLSQPSIAILESF